MLFTFHDRPLQFQTFSCYMPTSWEPDDAAEHVYDLLGMLLVNCDQAGAIPIIGGDFNAVIANPLPGDNDDLLGTCGFGPEMIEAGCLYGGCWNMVCLSKVVWIEIFDMTTVGLANVPWLEWAAGSKKNYLRIKKKLY